MFKIVVTKNEVSRSKVEEYCTQSYNELLQIEDKYTIEEIQRYINFFSYRSEEKKVGLIRYGNNLSIGMQNKLLKVLEETTESDEHVMFVTTLNGMLDTIKSRALIINENSEYQFKAMNKLEVFFSDIIFSENDAKFFYENEEYFRLLYSVCEAISRGEINVAVIKCAGIDFDKERIVYLFKWIENFIYQCGKVEKVIEVFELEKRINFQVNYNLLATMIIGEL